MKDDSTKSEVCQPDFLADLPVVHQVTHPLWPPTRGSSLWSFVLMFTSGLTTGRCEAYCNTYARTSEVNLDDKR